MDYKIIEEKSFRARKLKVAMSGREDVTTPSGKYTFEPRELILEWESDNTGPIVLHSIALHGPGRMENGGLSEEWLGHHNTVDRTRKDFEDLDAHTAIKFPEWVWGLVKDLWPTEI